MFAEITIYLHRARRNNGRAEAIVGGGTVWHQPAGRSEFRVPLRRAGRPNRLSDPKLRGFRCAFVYRPGIRRYVGASLQWDRLRELGEISPWRESMSAEFQIQYGRRSNRVESRFPTLPPILISPPWPLVIPAQYNNRLAAEGYA